MKAPHSTSNIIQRAIALHQAGRLSEALSWYDQAAEIDGNDAEIGNWRGVALAQAGRFEEALASLDRAVTADTCHVGAHVNRGIVLAHFGRHEEALASYDRAIALNSSEFGAFYNRGAVLYGFGRLEEALADYDRAIALAPNHADAHNNRGAMLDRLNRPVEAIASFERAIHLNSRHIDAWNNRGNALRKLQQHEAAVASYEQAITHAPENADAWNNRGLALAELRRPGEAVASFDRAIALKRDSRYAAGHRLHCKMLLAEWTNFAEERAALCRRTLAGHAEANPPIILTVSDDPAVNLACARAFAASFSAAAEIDAAPADTSGGRIRIGYFSADFHAHATMFLIAEMLEAHDRHRFELFAFSFGPDRRDEWRSRAERAVDRFLDVRFQSDREVAALARSLRLDIAVDLKGYTKDGRPGIFAARAAPVQVSFLGYPGTMGASFIDYLVADPLLVPEASRRSYSERIAYLPDSYQPNLTLGIIGERPASRSEAELPPHGFVFCCFNRAHKITPELFAVWMTILERVEGSVMWLWADEPAARENLLSEAGRKGIAADRLVFAPRAPADAHLRRLRLADLVLDTLPYNAHTTASDALRMGVPLVTCLGRSFAGRVAASLLTAVGLPELVTTSLADYEALAIRLGTDRVAHEALRRKLAANLADCPLFQPQRFARNLEQLYEHMHKRRIDGLPPDHILA